MAKGFKHGAGGRMLNFRVVGNPQPAAPGENTIWVDTNTKITGWTFSPLQPETAQEGMVWICTGPSGPVAFNALKKNGITVCPISAKQYASGAWVNVTAKSYQGGTWVDWLYIYLYQEGDTCDNVTGGWVSAVGATIQENRILLNHGGNGTSMARTKDKVDLTYIATLHFAYDGLTTSSESNKLYIIISDVEAPLVAQTAAIAATSAEFGAVSNLGGTLSLNVSGVSGSHYIYLAAETTHKYGSLTCCIRELKGEVQT